MKLDINSGVFFRFLFLWFKKKEKKCSCLTLAQYMLISSAIFSLPIRTYSNILHCDLIVTNNVVTLSQLHSFL
jgi:hypothetical protein